MIAAKKMQALPFEESDRESLEKWRTEFADATLELTHDYASEQVETAVVRDEDGKIILALTGTIAVGLGPLIKNPAAAKLEIMQGLFLAEAALNYGAVKAGAIDSYITVPERMSGYIKTLEKLGYEVVATKCVILGRVLRKDAPVKPVESLASADVESIESLPSEDLAEASFV